MAYKRSNLIALVYASNRCYTNVVPLNSEIVKNDVVIDTARETWKPKQGGTIKIGSSRNDKYGCVIGIYDRTRIEHLSSMVRAGKEATTITNYHDVD